MKIYPLLIGAGSLAAMSVAVTAEPERVREIFEASPETPVPVQLARRVDVPTPVSLDKAEAFQIVWNSWSPGYFNGILLNDYVVFAHGDVNYRPRVYRITSDAVYKLEPGANFVTTRQVPKKHGTEMVHGAEVQYPGFIVLIRYARP